MLIRACLALAGTTALVATLHAGAANALSMHECSVKYKAARAAGTLGGMKWGAFRKSECNADGNAAAAPAPKSSGTSPVVFNVPGNAVFPTSISSKYARESAGKARMHTCLAQYKLNKASGANGSLKWIQKGGGYYSECNKRLKQ